MKIKRFGALLLSAVLCIGMAAPAFAAESIRPADAAWMPAPAHLRDCAHTAVPRDSLRLPVRRSLGVHAESNAGRPNSRELTAACSGDCPTHKKLSGNITSATTNTEAIA